MEIAYSGITNPRFLAKQECQIGLKQVELKAVPSNAETPTPSPKKKSKKGVLKTIISAVLALILLSVGGYYGMQSYQYVTTHEDTDDAYVTGHLHQISTRINGTVQEVLVDDNEHVKAGQVLVTLDPRDFKVKAEQALANLEQAERRAKTAQTSITFQDTTAKGQNTDAKGSVDNAVAAISKSQAAVREAKANIDTAQSQLAAKEAELERAKLDYDRFQNLEREGAVSTSDRDAAKRDYLVALETRNAAREIITQATERFAQAQQSVNTSKAELKKAEAQIQLANASAVQTKVTEHEFQTDMAAVAGAKALLNEANLNLSYTHIVAPTSGRIGRKTVEAGQRIEPGQPLMTIVADDLWVVANFKETQLKNMKPGQRVEIKIDSFPDHKFEGNVQSFSPASGSSFAVLPSDNATGNFTKIVQRIPVKILFTPGSVHGYEDRMAPGLSVITSVDVANNTSTQQVAALH